MIRKTLVRTVLTVLTAVAVLTGCGSPGGDTTTPAPTGSPSAGSPADASGDHNATDVAFARQMIPHHEQAVEMAELVRGRTSDPDVLDLAEHIARAQGPEIATMTAWLRAWGVPATSTGHAMPGMDHGSGMAGMMSEEEMTRLRQAEGDAFDRQWLSMMIAHHEGAVEMARTELADGADTEAKALARRIVDSQQAEIDEMRTLLSQG
jgi:uncharacterized protein (DUF305 family)